MRSNRLWALVAQGALMAAFALCALWGLQFAPVRLHESAIHKTHFCVCRKGCTYASLGCIGTSLLLTAMPSTGWGGFLCHTDACCICVGNGFLQQFICLRTSLATLLHLCRLWGKITQSILFSFLTNCFIATARLHHATSNRVLHFYWTSAMSSMSITLWRKRLIVLFS